MIQIKTPDEIALMREAGLITQRALAAMRAAVRPGITTGELDRIAEDSIRSEGAVPSFLGYRGFTGTICASIDDEVVHFTERLGSADAQAAFSRFFAAK